MHLYRSIPGAASFLAFLLSSLMLVLGPASATAQSSPTQVRQFQQYVRSIDRMPPALRRTLSSGAMDLYRIASTISEQSSAALVAPAPDPRLAADADAMALPALDAQLAPGVVHVSDPRRDYRLSLLGGFSQDESSTAWCGSTVVVGYQDTGAELRTAGLVAGSMGGVASSFDAGRSFHSLPFLNPGTEAGDLIGFNPVLKCVSAQKFYYASLGGYCPPTEQICYTGIVLSTSSDGGVTWQEPIFPTRIDSEVHTYDAEWLAVDGHDPRKLYMTYTDYDYSTPYNKTGLCAGQYRTAIEIVHSVDGGLTWTNPIAVSNACYDPATSSGASITGSQVVVDNTGRVAVTWELYGSGNSRALRFASSTDGAKTFGGFVTAANVVPVGGYGALQVGILANEFPSLAADPANGTLYMAWADGRDLQVPDLTLKLMGDLPAVYGYGAVYFVRSTDHGRTWSRGIPISRVAPGFSGMGHDQFMPGIAVDARGRIATCYYDRRNDPLNRRVDRYCSESADGGVHWADSRKTVRSWTPVQNEDLFLSANYIGDYDTLAADTLGLNSGFAGAFQIQTAGNPDIYLARF